MKKRPISTNNNLNEIQSPPIKKQQTASIFNMKPVASTSSSTSTTPSTNTNLFKEQPHLRVKGSGGACHVVYGNWKGSDKIAAFDLDGTVIKPKNGGKWPKDSTDWEFWSKVVSGNLKELHSKGFSIVFVSNQAGLPKIQKAFVQKLGLIGKSLGIPFRAFGAFDYDLYRKPSPGLWVKFVRDFNDGIAIDYDQSFFVGDAAGRVADHSDCDRKFALNAGLRFSTPEEYFFSKPVNTDWKWNKTTWNPADYDHNIPIFTPTNTPLIPRSLSASKKQEVIIFIGPPAIGKTFFYKQYFEPAGYVSINPDLTTRATSIALLRTTLSLSTRPSIIIDSRFSTQTSRKHYLEILQSEFSTISVRAFWFVSSSQIAKHNAFFRVIFDEDVMERERGMISDEEFAAYLREEKPPVESEGFEEIKKIYFSFEGDETRLKNWNKFLNSYKYKQPIIGQR